MHEGKLNSKVIDCLLLNVQRYIFYAYSLREMVESVLQYINIIQKWWLNGRGTTGKRPSTETYWFLILGTISTGILLWPHWASFCFLFFWNCKMVSFTFKERENLPTGRDVRCTDTLHSSSWTNGLCY